VGGLLFGYGMAQAGNCGYGVLARLGGGDMRALLIAIVMGITASAALFGVLGGIRPVLFPIEPAGAAVPGLAHMLETATGLPRSALGIALGGLALALSIRFQTAGLRHCRVGWGIVAGLAISSGFLGTAWVAAHGFEPWPVSSHSFTAPIGETLHYAMFSSALAPKFGIGSVIGVILGSALGSLIQEGFRWEACDDPRELRRQMAGAVAMGLGAVLAAGCSPASSAWPSPARCRRRPTTRPCRSPCRSRSKAPTRPSRPGPRSAMPMCATTIRPIRPREIRPPEGGARGTLPRHDHPVLHRRAVGRGARTGRHAAVETGHGLAVTVGSNNFPTRVYENPPDLVDWLAAEMLANDVKPEIEAFDLSHIQGRADGIATGRLPGDALRAVRDGREERDARRPRRVRLLCPHVERFFSEKARHGAPPASGQPDRAERMGHRRRRACAHRAGGQCAPRPRYTLAPSNAALVRRAVEICERHERPVASPAEARAILGAAA
jgi:hypothetical protein